MSKLLYFIGVTITVLIGLLAQQEGSDPQKLKSKEMAIFHLKPDR